MANTWLHLARDLADRLDADLPARLSGTMDVDPSAFRAELSQRKLAFLDPAAGHRPTPDALARTADHLIVRATRQAVVSGAVGGMAGMAGVAPEVAWRLVQLIRLSQRLAVVYGQDPTTERGRVLVQQALAAGLEVDLPSQQGVGLKISDIPTVFRGSAPTMHQGASWLAQVAVRQTAHAVMRPVGRIVPGLAMGPAAWRARRTMQEQAGRIHAVIRRGADGPHWPTGEYEEAKEVL